MYYDEEVTGLTFGGDKFWLENSDLPFAIKCIGHSLSNATRWSVEPFMLGGNPGDDARCAIKGAREGSTALHEHVGEFVIKHMDFDDDDTVSDDELKIWWTLIGVTKSFLDVLIQLNPVWLNGRLYVRGKCRNDPEVIAKVSSLVTYSLRFYGWSLTRWVKAGRCGRCFMRALAMGLDGLWALTAADNAVSCYHLHLFDKADFNVRRMLAVLAVSAFPAEAVLLQVLIDDRLLKRADEFRTIAAEQTLYIANLPMYVYERLSTLLLEPCSPLELRHWVMRATHVAGGYVYRDTFRQLEEDPLRYAQGDLCERIGEIQMRPTPIRCVAVRRMRNLIDAGHEAKLSLDFDMTGAWVDSNPRKHSNPSENTLTLLK